MELIRLATDNYHDFKKIESEFFSKKKKKDYIKYSKIPHLLTLILKEIFYIF